VKLYCGDCLEILPTITDKVNAIITDLPYGTTACKWDTIIPFEPMWKEVKRVLKPNGVFITTASQPFTTILIYSNIQSFKYEIIFDKGKSTGHLDAKNKPMKRHENICVFCDGKPTYNPQFTKGRKHKNGAYIHNEVKTEVYGKFKSIGVYTSDNYYPTSILEIIPEAQRTLVHSTQKPVSLYEYLIRTYTNEGETVLDFCMGSGTTGVACVQTGRDFIGIEINPDYYNIAERRIKEAQQQIRLAV